MPVEIVTVVLTSNRYRSNAFGMDPAHVRLARFLVDQGWTRQRAAVAFGCSPGFVSMLAHGQKTPGRRIAHAIEAATEGWPGGVIRSLDWDEATAPTAPATGTDPA